MATEKIIDTDACERMRAIRIILGVNQDRFGAMLGMGKGKSRMVIARWETGHAEPSKFLQQAAEMLLNIHVLENLPKSIASFEDNTEFGMSWEPIIMQVLKELRANRNRVSTNSP